MLKLLDKLYRKSELGFALAWIGVYVVVMSTADGLSAAVGAENIFTAPLSIAMVLVLFIWIRKSGLTDRFGLCKAALPPRKSLLYLPLALICSVNLWYGVRQDLQTLQTALGVVSMVCVGFSEEIIFRGFLFRALEKDSLKRAVIISSVTFGFGHIINLLSGAPMLETLMQIAYATAVGFLFTVLFLKGKSLWPCIVTHSAVNGLSVIANTDGAPLGMKIFTAAFLCVIPAAYAAYLLCEIKGEAND